MKPKQPDFSKFYDYVSIYSTFGSRTSSGGFTESQTLERSIWANVQVRTIPGEPATDETGRRRFVKSLKITTYKGQVENTNLVQYNGEMYFVYNIDDSNQAHDLVYCEIVQ